MHSLLLLVSHLLFHHRQHFYRDSLFRISLKLFFQQGRCLQFAHGEQSSLFLRRYCTHLTLRFRQLEIHRGRKHYTHIIQLSGTRCQQSSLIQTFLPCSFRCFRTKNIMFNDLKLEQALIYGRKSNLFILR